MWPVADDELDASNPEVPSFASHRSLKRTAVGPYAKASLKPHGPSNCPPSRGDSTNNIFQRKTEGRRAMIANTILIMSNISRIVESFIRKLTQGWHYLYKHAHGCFSAR